MVPSLVLLVALAFAPASTREQSAERAKERALDLWEEGRYDEAREEIARAYELAPMRRYLYARARIEQADGHCDVANEYYRKYLAEDPPELAAKATQRAIAACERELAAKRAPPPPPAPSMSDAPPPPWWRDPVALGLVGSGAGVLAIGLGFFGRALVLDREARATEEHDEFDRRVREAKVFSPIGIAGISLGAALVVGGVVRWAVVRRRGRTSGRVAIGPGGMTLRW